ncbi:MAG TPA: hypothetical protein ENK19_05270 [Acidobacteria bacterium]|nr:hypothetical protein [Acidobacteriota bacterium]
MSRSRQLAVAGAVLALAAAALLLLIRPAAHAEASSVSRRSEGLLLARRYLEARGVRCSSLTGAIGRDGPRAGAVVMAFPATEARGRGAVLNLARWMRRGGTLVILFDDRGPGPGQRETLEVLGVATRPIWRREELDPTRWWREVRTPWRLESPAGSEPVEISSQAHLALKPRPGDRVLLEEKDDSAVLGLVRAVGRGSLLVLPSEAFSNGRLLAGGNADLLEWVLRRLPPGATLAFDEAIHGLGTPVRRAPEGTPMADALLAQLALIYLLVVLALAWRQGPAWPEEGARGGSVGGLLLRLGAVHRRMGHHAEAARAMVERAAALGRWEGVPPEINGLLDEPRRLAGTGLVRLGRRVALRQRLDGRKER